MAALDKMLQSLVDRKMEALMLEPDNRPRMRKSGLEHDASSTALAAPTIAGLLGQVAPDGAIAEPPAPGRAEFDYQYNGELFHLTCLRTEAGWSALVVAVGDQQQKAQGPADDAPPLVELEEITATVETTTTVATVEPRLISNIEELLRLMLDRGASDLHLCSHQQVR